MKHFKPGLLALGSFLSFNSILNAADSLTKWEAYIDGEAENAQDTVNELVRQVKGDYIDKGKRVFRDAHPHAIGCVKASFIVDPNLESPYRTGLFSKPGQAFDSFIRFSSAGLSGPSADNVKDARGLAIKVLGVPGKKLLADELNATTHDFILINFPFFPMRDAVEFGALVKVRTNVLNAGSFLLKNPILRAKELKSVLDFGANNPNNGKSLAVQTFFSEVPYLFESKAIQSPVKYLLRPCAAVKATTLDGSANELRNDLQNRLSSGGLCFEFGAQFLAEGQSVEDGRNEWTLRDSPFVKLANITIPQQKFATNQRLHYCDGLSMAPWHALPEHRPLGNINRTRKVVYEKLSEFRHKGNAEARTEPLDASAWDALTSPQYDVWSALTVPKTAN